MGGRDSTAGGEYQQSTMTVINGASYCAGEILESQQEKQVRLKAVVYICRVIIRVRGV